MNAIGIILAIFLPSIAAFLTFRVDLHFGFNIFRAVCCVVLGMIHAPWLVLKNATGPD